MYTVADGVTGGSVLQEDQNAADAERTVLGRLLQSWRWIRRVQWRMDG